MGTPRLIATLRNKFVLDRYMYFNLFSTQICVICSEICFRPNCALWKCWPSLTKTNKIPHEKADYAIVFKWSIVNAFYHLLWNLRWSYKKIWNLLVHVLLKICILCNFFYLMHTLVYSQKEKILLKFLKMSIIHVHWGFLISLFAVRSPRNMALHLRIDTTRNSSGIKFKFKALVVIQSEEVSIGQCCGALLHPITTTFLAKCSQSTLPWGPLYTFM